MLHNFTYDNADDMHDMMCRGLLLGRFGEDYNWAGSSEVGIDSLTLGVTSFTPPDMNLARLWLTQSRWDKMVRQYIDPGALDATLGMVKTHLSKSKRKSGTATLRMMPTDEVDEPGPEVADLQTNLVTGTHSGRQVRRRWGSCMLALTYRNVPAPTVTLTSRTTYFGYLAILDLMVANVFAQQCAGIVGLDMDQVRFVWHINLAQFHGFRSLAFAASQPRMLRKMDECVDDDKAMARFKEQGRVGWLRLMTGYKRIVKSDRAGVLYGDESFSSFARVRRRFHTEIHGYDYARQFEGGTRLGLVKAFQPIPDLMCGDLTFKSIGM